MIDYIGSIFNLPILTSQINTPIFIINAQSYLMYKTTALVAMVIDEDTNRALTMDAKAMDALERSLGISTKGRQSTS